MGNQKRKFYFTNPTFDRHKGQEVRLRIEAELGGEIELLSPFYDKAGNPTPEIKALDKGEVPEGVSRNDIVEEDLRMILESDGIVAWVTNRTSWGSIQECCIAYREYHLPVYLIFDPKTTAKCGTCNGFNPNSSTHPWATKHATRVFKNVSHFIDFAKKEFCNACEK